MNTITPAILTRPKTALSTQPLMKGKINKSAKPFQGLTTDKLVLSSPKFSGRKMQDDKDEQAELEEAMEALNIKIEKVSTATRNGAAVGGTIGGGAGFMGSLATLAADGFALTAGGATGGGAVVGGVTRFFSKKRHGDPDYNQGLIDGHQQNHNQLAAWLAQGNASINGMSSLERKANTAVEAKGVFEDSEYHALKHGLHDARYDEVRDKATAVKPKAGKVPGFAKLYKQITGKEWAGNPRLDLENDLNNGSPETQALALQRYYPIEEGKSGSAPQLYKGFLSHKDVKVAATALRMMNKHPELRGDSTEYTKVLERFLDSGNPEKVGAALEGVMVSNQKSTTINLMLERISHPRSEYSPELRRKALEANTHRFAQGTNRTVNPRETSKRLLNSMVGNQHLQRNLVKILNQYQGALRAAGNDSPALTLYLPGEPGIGKTTLVQRLQNELHNDPDGLKIIRVGDLRTGDDLLDQLREHAPLQGKTIFLDEFHNLDKPELNRGRMGLIQVMKDLFSTEDETGTGEHIMSAQHGINVKDTILAVGTNKSLPDMPSMKDEIGSPLKSRILSQANRLELESNLDNHVMELIEGFEPHRFYDKVKDRKFEGPIHLTDQAKEVLARELPPEAQSNNEHSGRFYVNQLVKQINDAIDESESNSSYRFERNRQGKVTEPLTIEVDGDGFLVAKSTQ